MKKLLLLIALFSLYRLSAVAQPFENSWIRYNQEYYKVKVWQEGIYRINRQSLIGAGFNLSGVDPRRLQIFRDGIEQYIHVEGESDGSFDGSDFIEFYGRANDGTQDRRMYPDTAWQPGTYYSLFTDTAIYFITYNPSGFGRRLSAANDTSFSSYTPADYFMKQSLVMGKDVAGGSNGFSYNRGLNDQSIDYRESEGWGTRFGTSGSSYPLTVPVPTANVYVNGPNVEINTNVGGVNNLQHNFTLTGGSINFSDIYYAQMLRKYDFSLSPASLSSPTTSYVFNVSTPAGTSDINMFYWMTVKYPHTFNMEGASKFRLYLPDAGSQSSSRLDMTNFNSGGVEPVFYDLTNNRRVAVRINGGVINALVPNSGGEKICYIAAASTIISPSVSKINYFANNPGYFNNFQVSSVDSAFIIITHRSLWNPASLYKAHRDVTTGGRTVMVDVEELYDQFAYGIQKHPLGIKNFANFIVNTWNPAAPPQHMFLIGKSISPADFRLNQSLFAQCLVASYGVPTSDMLLTSGIAGSIWEPKIPIGRLSAKIDSDITDYLAKVQEYENAQTGLPQPWQKEILHFGGGDNPQQQDELAGYLRVFENIMEDSLYGGHVTTYLKNSSSPIVINQSDTLRRQIEEGVSIMTFFGHASGSNFDQSTDEPSAYRNRGKYPLVVANSCFAGDIHTNQVSVSEKFVLEPQKAAIGFIASVGLGVPTFLFDYSKAFFEAASYTHYGKSIGQLMKRAIEVNQLFADEGHKIVCNEMSLQGDPSLKLNNFMKPEYSITESGIKFNPVNISNLQDTFSVTINTRNYGKAVQDSFYVKVTRTFPNGVDSVYTFRRGRCYYEDNVTFPVSTGGFSSSGINKFKVEVDLPDSVDEFDNIGNNIAQAELFIISSDIVPVFPPEYAIHPFNTVTLKASTSNPFAGVRNYIFQIDTVDLNIKDRIPGMQTSPLFRFTTITDSGGVIIWSPPSYTLVDSAVYFWRVANDSIQYDTTNYKWQQSSFMYIPGKTGFAQSHIYQYKENGFENVRLDTMGRRLRFIDNLKELVVTNLGQPMSLAETRQIGYTMNNTTIENDGCAANRAIMVAVLDSITIQPWLTCSYNFGQANTFSLAPGAACDFNAPGTGNCRNPARPEAYFIFRFDNDPSATQQQYMQRFNDMIDQVPDGNYVIVYSWLNYPYSTADPLFHSTMTGLGLNTGLLRDNAPFIYFVKKGDNSSALNSIGDNAADTIQLRKVLMALWNRGSMTSELIGPTTRWESLHWNQRPEENGTTQDQVSLRIDGLNSTTNVWDILAPNISFPVGRDTSLNWINAAQYPYLRISVLLQDDSLRTPPQLKYWRIYYDEVPECAINPNNTFFFHKNPLQEGDTVRMNVAIDNIGNVPMDSLGVRFYLYDNNRTKRQLKYVTLDSLRVGRYLTADVVIDNTFGLAGNNSLWVEANPLDTLHQLEKYHFNNLAEMKFKIDRDMINPILDVTFDGIHILNNDIVSGKPQITIQLQDENKFLALNDTTKFKIRLTPPGSTTAQILEWNTPMYGQALRFTPAQLPKNSCRIDWNPEFTADGTYTLDVEATDRTGNESGRYNYKISFEVINKSTITEVLNYPNPFSTSTRFVFTLTGNQVPTGMKIQIMTITGKIVREIMLNELGNIHIGRNITDYAWDGKDEFGDQLANGLYLYRVVTDLNGEKIEKRETEADQYFKKGWGKMYLMR